MCQKIYDILQYISPPDIKGSKTKHCRAQRTQGIVSSEGALYVILPYDYPQRGSTHFLNTHRSLTTTLSIDAVMTLLTVISMMTKITEIT